MKRFLTLILSFLILTAFVFAAGGCSPRSKYNSFKQSIDLDGALLVENISALDVYYRFIYSLKSAEITKITYDSGSLFGVFSYSTEEIIFSSPAFLYRKKNPVVFFDSPEYDYFDGENYYYNYKGTWYSDNYYADNFTEDLFGIPSEIFENYNFTYNSLFKTDDGYILKMQGTHKSNKTLVEITATADKNYSISKLLVEREPSDADGNKYKVFLFVEYSNVNSDIEVIPPESLSFENISY